MHNLKECKYQGPNMINYQDYTSVNQLLSNLKYWQIKIVLLIHTKLRNQKTLTWEVISHSNHLEQHNFTVMKLKHTLVNHQTKTSWNKQLDQRKPTWHLVITKMWKADMRDLAQVQLESG